MKKRFPLSIVWSPLPYLSKIAPAVGHTGIGSSMGIIHDFAGPYKINVDKPAFGEIYYYVVLDLKGISN